VIRIRARFSGVPKAFGRKFRLQALDPEIQLSLLVLGRKYVEHVPRRKWELSLFAPEARTLYLQSAFPFQIGWRAHPAAESCNGFHPISSNQTSDGV